MWVGLQSDERRLVLMWVGLQPDKNGRQSG